MGNVVEPALALLAAGGWVLVILLLLSLLALTIIIVKFVQFRSAHIGRRAFIDPALEQFGAGNPVAAREGLDRERNPIARLMTLALFPPKRLAALSVREEIERVAKQQLTRLRSYFRLLETIVTLSPLLGLLGTVLGMIEAFEALQVGAGGVDPGLLAGGISKALLTTAGGLIVAIPAAACLHAFEGAVDRLQDAMEDAVVRSLHAAAPHHGDEGADALAA